jgi:hypothetical protein
VLILSASPLIDGATVFRNILGAVKLNITTPHIVTGQGGTEEFDLNWKCRTDYCTGNDATFQFQKIPDSLI